VQGRTRCTPVIEVGVYCGQIASRHKNPSQSVLDWSFCHVASTISNLAETGPVDVTELEAKQQPAPE
jgi:hypothetical protein